VAIDDPKQLKRIDREIRINELKAQAEEPAGEEITGWESPDCPPDLAEQFWEHVVAFEQSPDSTHIDNLRERGLELLPPDKLTNAQLHAKLWEVIEALAESNAFLLSTNHLSDRELYERLYSDVLNESTYPGMDCYLDLVSSGSEEDIEAWLRYYADAETRAQWKRDFPETKLPPREKPPYDRDRKLPQSPRG